MKDRFEMPIEGAGPGYDIFAIDDFLRSIQTSEQRRKLILEVGFSPAKRNRFERRKGLPHGAVELAMMAEDRRVQEINRVLTERLPQAFAEETARDEIIDIYQQVASVSIGLRKNYPDATHFLVAYGQLAERTKRSFRGDYRFSYEYQILRVQQGGSNPPPPLPNVAQWLSVVANVGALVNVLVYANAVLFTMAALALAVAAVAAAFAGVPLYGQKQMT